MNITINHEQKLFVIPCGDGYSCRGFFEVFKDLKALAQKLGEAIVGHVEDAQIGTLEQYNQYRAAIGKIGNKDLGTWFNFDTPAKVRSILERYRKSGEKIRIFYGDTNTGCDWLEENDVVGTVGRSTGKMKIPLLIADGEYGGPGILDACIVRMIDVASRRELYRHPAYHQPELAIVAKPEPERSGKFVYTHDVQAGGKLQASFTSYGKAAAYVAFMTGEVNEQPA